MRNLKRTFFGVVQNIVPLVEIWQRNASSELEARFGTFHYPNLEDNQTRFDGSIDANFQAQIIAKLDEFKGWENVEEWVDFEDYFFSFTHPDINDGKRCEIRSRAQKDPVDKTWTVDHVIKGQDINMSVVIRPYASIDSNFGSGGTVPATNQFDTNRLMDIRISLKTEEPIVNGNEVFKNTIVRPHHVRLQQRKTYFYGGWAFSLSRVWSGVSREAAEISQRIDKAKYHFECEVVDKERVLAAKNSDEDETRINVRVVLSLLMQLDDFQPDVQKVYKVENETK